MKRFFLYLLACLLTADIIVGALLLAAALFFLLCGNAICMRDSLILAMGACALLLPVWLWKIALED